MVIGTRDTPWESGTTDRVPISPAASRVLVVS
jgi:hypothetical protein